MTQIQVTGNAILSAGVICGALGCFWGWGWGIIGLVGGTLAACNVASFVIAAILTPEEIQAELDAAFKEIAEEREQYDSDLP